jgi:hypothetical protein
MVQSHELFTSLQCHELFSRQLSYHAGRTSSEHLLYSLSYLYCNEDSLYSPGDHLPAMSPDAPRPAEHPTRRPSNRQRSEPPERRRGERQWQCHRSRDVSKEPRPSRRGFCKPRGKVPPLRYGLPFLPALPSGASWQIFVMLEIHSIALPLKEASKDTKPTHGPGGNSTYSTKPKCGAKTRAGVGHPCGRMAGHGTNHLGQGKCKYHGGCCRVNMGCIRRWFRWPGGPAFKRP